MTEELICPICKKPLKPIYDGLLACFCIWGGRRPSVKEIVAFSDDIVHDNLFINYGLVNCHFHSKHYWSFVEVGLACT